MLALPSIRSVSFGTLALLAAGAGFAVLQSGNGEAQERKTFPPGDPKELLKTFASELIEITPGEGKFPRSFSMGAKEGPAAERPAHEVAFAHSFYMAKYEVPQDLYLAVMKSNPSVWGGPRNSVEMMSWQDAVRFCREATSQMRQLKLIAADEELRLPTEAEWEYCCRAGSTTAYSFGDSATGQEDAGNIASILSEYGWHTGNAAGNDPPVGAKKPNAWGLYDMHGYLWEYVSDTWHGDYRDAPSDGRAWIEAGHSPQRVIRSGSWRDRYEMLQSTTRWAIPDHARSDAIGFRCVKAKKSPHDGPMGARNSTALPAESGM